MDVIKRNKTAQRAAFTKAYNNLETLLCDENVDLNELDICFELFKQKDEKLETTHLNYLDNLTVENEFESEYELVEELREKALRIKLRTQRLLGYLNKKSKEIESEKCDISHNSTYDESTRKVYRERLPDIELRKFGGELKDWLTFWNQFQKIHENKNLSDSEKFHYLMQCTENKSEAREIVETFPLTSENYPLAIECLKERYGREDVLIEVYVRELLGLVLNNASKKKQCSLSSLYNKLSTQLRALSSLGVTSDQCAIILYPLVESSLPVEILRLWERTRKQMIDKKVSDLDAIILFLRGEVESEERIKLARSDFTASNIREEKKSADCQTPNRPSAAELFNQKSVCLFCKRDHESRFCRKASYISMAEKISIIKRNGLCLICLNRGHMAKCCKSNVKCNNCFKRHLRFMCPDLDHNKSFKTTNEHNIDSEEKSVDTLQSVSTKEVFLQTLVVKMKGEKGEREARVIIDTGSQKSYILKSTATEIGFESQGEEEFSHSLFGGAKTKVLKHRCYKIYLSNLNGKYMCNLDALDQDVICNDISSIKNGSWIRELKARKIYLTDVRRDTGPIEILLGADVAGKLFTGKREELTTGLVALETKLGWTLLGKVPKVEKSVNMNVISMLSQDNVPISELWDLEIIGIRDPVEQKNKEESRRAIMTHFQETVQQKEDGRYEVNMPWKIDHSSLPDNYNLSLKRLDSTSKRLEKNGYRKEYQQVFEEWLSEEIIEEVPEAELSLPAHYLPHRPVVKENSTTKIRPVFDASAKIPNHPSLNDCLETGINLIETIPSIFTRFRQNKIGTIADIRKAFLQIAVHKRDRDFLRFLWYDDKNNVKVFRHTRVVFGVTSSPFLLGAVINHHLSKESLLEQNSKVILEKLRNSFYVDNCVTSVEDSAELEIFIEEATEILKRGKFDLRGWESTAIDACITRNFKSNVLGLIWDRRADTLEIDSESLQFDREEKVTKRKILSLVSKVFDPIGFLSPVMIQPKILLQETWKNKEPWDAEVKEDVKRKFLTWTKQLPYLKHIKIPRWLGLSKMYIFSLHTFVDASKIAYAACIFLRCEYPNGVNVQLLQAKARISPLKQITIPRLELLAATIGTRLCESSKEAFKLEAIKAFFWTDSSTVLAWIKRQEQWSVFVNNRVTEIRKLTAPENWFHIPGDKNPADLPSRGCGAKQLLKSLWWEGPIWLKQSEEHWPKSTINSDENEINSEKRRNVVSANNSEVESIVSQLARRCSQFSKIIRILAWVLRFRPKARDLRKYENITEEELSNARKTLFRCVQRESFSDENTRKSLKNLQVYRDDMDLLRMKSRLTNETDTEEFISPLILPSKHLVTERLIEEQHIVNKHAGALTLLTILRERFWILKGRKTVNAVIWKCIACKKQKVKNLEVPFPPLPKDRTTLSATFQVSGVDLAGPLVTKSNEKVWVVLFSCAVYRAVHLELVQSLSTSSFIQAMRRFIARRGRISVMYSDNGTNFVGLNTALKQLDWVRIQKEFEVNQIQWKFNPPSAPWWGGFWERLIGILKDLLRKNLGRSSLSYDELQTLVCECESIMNNRPLTYVSEEPELKTLTPSMFLQELRTNDVSDFDQIEKTSLVKRWNYIQKVRENLKQRFKSEYLGFLRSSNPKRLDTTKVGDLILIGSDDKKRLDWPLARVVKLFPGRDNIIRLAKVKTSKGYLMRPIQRLYPLEIRDEERPEHLVLDPENIRVSPEPCDITNDCASVKDYVPVQTRCGRLVKPVEKLNI